MTEKTFDSAFLGRLTLAVKIATRERTKPAERVHLDAFPNSGEDEAIYLAYEERGGDPAAAKKILAAAGEQCDQAFARIVQYIADEYGCGAIERTADAMLCDLTHDGLDAAESWADHLDSRSSARAPDSALRALLSAHRELEKASVALHDALLWPLATRIWPED